LKTRPVSQPNGAHGSGRIADKTATVAQNTVLAMQGMIRAGRFKPGEPLPPQRELAQNLGVSRASLREAVSVLATIGLLSIEHGRGTFVVGNAEREAKGRVAASWRFAARYSPEEVYQFRYIAESHAAQLAVMKHTVDELAELNTNLDLFRSAAGQGALAAYAEADFEFHALVMRFSRNRLLADMHRNFASVLLESQRLPLIQRDDLWQAVIEHERIVEAFTRNDPEGGRYYMRQHLSRACARAGIALTEIA